MCCVDPHTQTPQLQVVSIAVWHCHSCHDVLCDDACVSAALRSNATACTQAGITLNEPLLCRSHPPYVSPTTSSCGAYSVPAVRYHCHVAHGGNTPALCLRVSSVSHYSHYGFCCDMEVHTLNIFYICKTYARVTCRVDGLKPNPPLSLLTVWLVVLPLSLVELPVGSVQLPPPPALICPPFPVIHAAIAVGALANPVRQHVTHSTACGSTTHGVVQWAGMTHA